MVLHWRVVAFFESHFNLKSNPTSHAFLFVELFFRHKIESKNVQMSSNLVDLTFIRFFDLRGPSCGQLDSIPRTEMGRIHTVVAI